MTRTARRSPPQMTVTGKVDGVDAVGLLIATDASGVGRSAMFATGYVATTGHYGADARPTPPGVTGRSDILIAELRAVHRAVGAVRKDHPAERVTVLCDNRDAVGWCCRWLAGEVSMPDGYLLTRSGGKPSSLAQLHSWLIADESLYDVKWIKGHNGHPLNEAAHSLALMAGRVVAGIFDPEGVRRAAPARAAEALRELATPKGPRRPDPAESGNELAGTNSVR